MPFSMRSQPKKMSLLACMRCCPARHPLPAVGVVALLLTKRSQHRGLRLLGLQEQGVGDVSMALSSSTIQALVPTLPTPTTLRAISTTRNRSRETGADRLAGSGGKLRSRLWIRLEELAAPSSSGSSSLSGTINGGSLEDAGLPVHHMGQLVEGGHAVLGAGLGDPLWFSRCVWSSWRWPGERRSFISWSASRCRVPHVEVSTLQRGCASHCGSPPRRRRTAVARSLSEKPRSPGRRRPRWRRAASHPIPTAPAASHRSR